MILCRKRPPPQASRMALEAFSPPGVRKGRVWHVNSVVSIVVLIPPWELSWNLQKPSQFGRFSPWIWSICGSTRSNMEISKKWMWTSQNQEIIHKKCWISRSHVGDTVPSTRAARGSRGDPCELHQTQPTIKRHQLSMVIKWLVPGLNMVKSHHISLASSHIP